MSSAMIAGMPCNPRQTAARRRAPRLGGFMVLVTLLCASAPARCQEGAEWDRARAELMAGQPGTIAPAIARWRQLAGSDSLGFEAYAGFVMTWPGLPDEQRLRTAAEKSIDISRVDPARLVAFFDRFAPVTNAGRAQYALALANLGRREAASVARAAWRGGSMSDAAEAAIQSRWGAGFTTDDADARLEALLWDGNAAQAGRILPRASMAEQAVARARLALQQNLGADSPGSDSDDSQSEMARVTAMANPTIAAHLPGLAQALPGAQPGTPAPALPAPDALAPQFLGDPGYLVDRARYLLRQGRTGEAVSLLATRPPLTRPALDMRRWVHTLLAVARNGDPSSQMAIATGAREGFPAGTDVSQQAFGLRDEYTSLMWLGATAGLWQLGDAPHAAPLFWRYATAARTPQTRAKGFYWAARALTTAGRAGEANAYLESAARFPDEYYGQLALEKLGRPLPNLHDPARAAPSQAWRASFAARPIAQAARELARSDADWPTTIRFFRALADEQQSEMDFTLAADFARSIGRRDLAVVVAQAAENAGYDNFRDLAFPLIPTPPGSDWTMVHAIARQESQFSPGAISRTGARGLMQLMPATGADQARKLGLSPSPGALTTDPMLNMTLGDAFFARLMTSFDGSYPLAVAAYNAGPGAVRRWLSDRGDPRNGGRDWVEWLERLPYSETRGYVQHVIENAVVYEAMNPAHASYRGPNPTSHFLTVPKPQPAPLPATPPPAYPSPTQP